MDKFKRYLCAIFSFFFLLIFFIKVPYYNHPYPTMLTPLDDSAIVNMTLGRTDPVKIWRKLTDFMNNCDRQGTDPCSQMCRHVDFDTVLGNMRQISERHPEFWEQFSADMKVDWQFGSPERRRFTVQANKVYAKYLAQIQGGLKLGFWLVNIGWLVLIILGVVCRQFPGGVLWSPFDLAWRILTGGARPQRKFTTRSKESA